MNPSFYQICITTAFSDHNSEQEVVKTIQIYGVDGAQDRDRSQRMLQSLFNGNPVNEYQRGPKDIENILGND